MPDALARSFANRGYYGSVSHNVKAAYVYYLGWFDGNPANLHPLPPTETAQEVPSSTWVAPMRSSRRPRSTSRPASIAGSPKVLNQVVFADPDNQAARELLADTYEQLGYQAENGTWRNFYLSGAKELREGVKVLPTPRVSHA